MTLVTIDRGNSTWDLAVHAHSEAGAEGELLARERIAVHDRTRLRELLDAWRIQRAAASSPPVFVASSVVGATAGDGPSGLEPLRELLTGSFGAARLVVAGVDLPCPLASDYPDPSTLGVDRWLGALAAHARHGAAVTVDCGTALTVNVVDRSGCFRGGAIGPGATTMAHGLASRAPGLPPAGDWSEAFSLPKNAKACGSGGDRSVEIPVDSPTAVTTGVALAFCGAIERLVREVSLGAGVEPATRVLTGGEAGVYLLHGRLAFEHVPDLVHRGLAELWRTRPSSS